MTKNHASTAPQEKVCGYEYTVRRGDSFYLIANRLGVPLRDLLEANSHINPARLMVGDVLCIPTEEDDAPAVPETPVPETPVPEPPVPETPDVMPDEDLDTPAQPQQPASPDGNIQDDAMLVCPEANRRTVAAGETVADILLSANINLHTLQTANPTVDLSRLTAGQVLCIPDTNQPCAVRPTYTLQTNETLESTALRLNASLSALLHANPCLAPSDFRAGACIYIPE